MTVGWKSISYPARLLAQVCHDHPRNISFGANLIIGEVKMIRGQGMPSMRHHDFGNLYMQFDVKFPPKGFNSQQKLEMLESVLPPRTPQALPPPNAMIDDYPLEEVDPSGQRRAQGATGMDEEEEDGMPQGAERMQCASQ